MDDNELEAVVDLINRSEPCAEHGKDYLAVCGVCLASVRCWMCDGEVRCDFCGEFR